MADLVEVILAFGPCGADCAADVNGDLPAQEILAFIPGTKHGTREVFDVKVLEAGCAATGALEALMGINGGDKKAAEAAYKTAVPAIDRSVAKGIMPKNKAARHKSRLNDHVRAL